MLDVPDINKQDDQPDHDADNTRLDVIREQRNYADNHVESSKDKQCPECPSSQCPQSHRKEKIQDAQYRDRDNPEY